MKVDNQKYRFISFDIKYKDAQHDCSFVIRNCMRKCSYVVMNGINATYNIPI